MVSLGYPEITIDPENVPNDVSFGETSTFEDADIKAKAYVHTIKSALDTGAKYWTFNSTLTIGPDGRVLAHYRKTHLYYSDAVWASPSIRGFSMTPITFPMQQPINTSFAICMDLNPKAFTADWQDFEVARHMLSKQSALLIVSTAWLTNRDAVEINKVSPCCPEDTASVPEMDSLSHWIERLTPLIQHETKTIVVIANRVGNEEGAVKACDLDNLIKPTFHSGSESAEVKNLSISRAKHTEGEDSDIIPAKSASAPPIDGKMAQFMTETSPGIAADAAHYSGSSAILTFGNGKVEVFGYLGRGVQQVLIADTNDSPVMPPAYPS